MNKYVVEIVTRSYGWDQASATVYANSKEEAENKTKVLRNIQYFRKWSLWIEQSFTVHLH